MKIKRRWRPVLYGSPNSIAGQFVYAIHELPNHVLAEIQLEMAYEVARRQQINSLLLHTLGERRNDNLD